MDKDIHDNKMNFFSKNDQPTILFYSHNFRMFFEFLELIVDEVDNQLLLWNKC
jgi:hypothetical protein